MNTYYSNLIEGHDTQPRDIERALAQDFEHEQQRKNLQLEAAAHVRVQADIDRMAAEDRLPDGNGRVSRLMSHAMAIKAGIDARTGCGRFRADWLEASRAARNTHR